VRQTTGDDLSEYWNELLRLTVAPPVIDDHMPYRWKREQEKPSIALSWQPLK
jgi:hypothetical protein